MADKKSPLISPTIHEEMIERRYARDPLTREIVDCEILAAMSRAVRTMREAAEQAVKAHVLQMENPMLTRIANERESRKVGMRLLDRARQAYVATAERANNTLGAMHEKMKAPPGPKSTIEQLHEKEIREGLARLAPDARTKVVNAAIKSGDMAIVGAFLRAVPVVSGISATEIEAYRGEWQKHAFPILVDRKQRIDLAFQDLDRALKATIKLIEGLTDEAAIARAVAAEERAKEASRSAA